MDKPPYIFPAPNLFTIMGAPVQFGCYGFFAANLSGGKHSKYAFGWHQEVPGKGSPTGTWFKELCFADYTIGQHGHAKIVSHYSSTDAAYTESNWLKADGTVLRTKRTAVPHDLRLNIEWLEEDEYHKPGVWRLGLTHDYRPVLMGAKQITNSENQGPNAPFTP